MHLFEYFSLGLIVLLGAMSPGPDFVIVTKNSLFGSRKLGMLTALGVTAALTIHISYTSLGLAVIIHQSKTLYLIIKILGAGYLTYMGIQLIRTRNQAAHLPHHAESVKNLTPRKAFTAGFLCNLLNPKASLFFLGIFTQIVSPSTSFVTLSLIAFEILVITFLWFGFLSFVLTHHKISEKFKRFQSHLHFAMGVLLIGFAFKLALS